MYIFLYLLLLLLHSLKKSLLHSLRKLVKHQQNKYKENHTRAYHSQLQTSKKEMIHYTQNNNNRKNG